MTRTRSSSRTIRLAALELLRAVLVVGVLAAGAASTAGAITLPPGWSHAQVNVIIRHQPHTLVYDRGRLTRVSRSSLTLRERDGSVVVISVSPRAAVTLEGRRAALSMLRPGQFALTVRVDGGAADEVHAQENDVRG